MEIFQLMYEDGIYFKLNEIINLGHEDLRLLISQEKDKYYVPPIRNTQHQLWSTLAKNSSLRSNHQFIGSTKSRKSC